MCLFFLQAHRETDRFFSRFRSSACAIYQWPVPLPPRGVLLTVQVEDRQHSRQGCSTTDHFEYRRNTFSVTISHSPVTLANLSSINLVSIFRCSSPPRNPVYVRRVDPSGLVFSTAIAHSSGGGNRFLYGISGVPVSRTIYLLIIEQKP